MMMKKSADKIEVAVDTVIETTSSKHHNVTLIEFVSLTSSISASMSRLNKMSEATTIKPIPNYFDPN